MAEEFQAGVCGENWWNPSRSEFMASPCSLGVNDLVAFGYCPTDHMVDSKTKAFFGDSSNSSSSSLAFEQDNIVGFGFGVSTSTSPISDFNQVNNLLNGRVDSNNNYESILQEDNMCTKLNCRKESSGFTASSQIQKDCWSPNNLDDDTTFNSFIINNKNNNQGLSSSGFPIISSANSFGYNTTTTTTSSTLLQSWFDNDESDQSQQSFYNNNNSSNNPTSASNNSTPFWNIAPPPNSSRSHFLSEDKHNCLSLIKDNKNEEVEDYSGGSVVKKSGSDNQTLLKRPRIETPSPLPTFKVRKEKLGDRITALQQLVSPFGKTDTASVLHEAIEYIKFLHDQVSTLSSPYLKNGAHNSNNQQQKESECPNQDLNSRGLCLVPISSTVVPLASETTADFWTLTFGLGSS